MESRRTTRRNVTRISPTRKSPARKSPGRKSPARKSPARKSPARKSPVRKLSPTSKSKLRSRPKSQKTDSDSSMEKVKDKNPVLKVSLTPFDKVKNKTNEVVTSKSVSTTSKTQVKVVKSSVDKDVEVAKITESIRQRAQAKLENLIGSRTPTPSDRSFSRSVSRRSTIDEDDHTNSEYSDNEKEAVYESFNKYDSYKDMHTLSYAQQDIQAKSINRRSEFGGSLGAFLLIILIIALSYFVQFICTRQQCSCTVARLEKLKSIGTFFNLESSYLFFGYTWAVFLLAGIPLGRIVKIAQDRGFKEYIFNGFATAFIVVATLITAEYLNYSPIKLITRNYQRLLSLSLIYAIIISGWFYVRSKYIPSFKLNPHANSGKFLSDFFIGKEIDPRWFDVINIKLAHYRISLITTLIFNGIFIYKNLKFTAIPVGTSDNITITERSLEIANHIYATTTFDPIALLISGLIIVYILDLLIFEHHLTSSFELQGEGVGAQLLLRYAIYPHLTSLIAKYALEHPITGVPVWGICLTILLFVIGLLVKRRSNKIKYEFRMNPANPKFNIMESLNTYQGRRLLVSSYWGLLRHPNYLADIIAQSSLLIPLIWNFSWPPLVATLFSIIILIHRAKRLDERNFNRYHSAWQQYTVRVKYALVPYIY